MNTEQYDRIDRAVKSARTYARKAGRLIHVHSPLQVGYQDLMIDSIELAADIVEKLPDSYFETITATSFLDGQPFKYNASDDLAEALEKLTVACAKRAERGKLLRRIGLLENTEGRSPGEVEAFKAKAAELRQQL